MKILKILAFILLGLFLFAGIALWVLYQQNNLEKIVLDENTRTVAPGNFVDLSNGFTHYQQAGSDTSRAVVLVHGFSVPYYIWDGTFEVLRDSGFQVLRYDTYGRGYSDRANRYYEAALFRTQLLELIREQELEAPVHLVGLSFGGPMVTDFALQHPDLVDKIVLIDPAAESIDLPYPRWLTTLYFAIQGKKMAENQLRDFSDPALFPGWVEKYKDQMQYKGFRRALVSTMYDYGAPIKENYATLNGQNRDVLLIWGEEDQTVPYAYSDSIRQVLDVEFLSVPDVGHVPHLEAAELVNEYIVRFLR